MKMLAMTELHIGGGGARLTLMPLRQRIYGKLFYLN